MKDLLRRAAAAAFCLVAAAAGPSADAACNPRPIAFQTGATSTEVTGGVARGERECLVVTAHAGQMLSVRQAPSPDGNIAFQLYLPAWQVVRTASGSDVSGATLPGAGPTDDASSWSGKLPSNGKYLLVVGTTRGSGEYRLHVEIR